MADPDPPALVVFKSYTPVVGVEFNPRVDEKAEFTYQYRWERFTDKIQCFVHKLRNARWQCKDCVKFALPMEGSYHCSGQCWNDAWEYHRQCHQEARNSKSTYVPEDEVGDRSGQMYDDFVVNQGGPSWLELASTRTYVPSEHDLGCVLRLSTLVVETETSDVKSTEPVIEFPSLPQRDMFRTITDTGRYNSAQRTFKVLSYNILGDNSAKSKDLWGNWNDHPKWSLQWEYRRKNLLREIIKYDADIICLQEVQDNHLEDFVNELQDHGYSVAYKNIANFDMDEKISVKDGCATFFRSAKFNKIDEFQLAYQMYNGGGPLRWLKDNVAIMIKLELTGIEGPSSNFYVANTHIHAQEDSKDVKLFQVSTLVHELEKLSVPVLLCGDLNSCPGSAPYDFIVNRGVDYNHSQFPIEHCDILSALKLDHKLSLLSAYAGMPGERDQFTHFKKYFAGTLDYIFYTEDRFWVKGVLRIPDIREGEHIPSPSWSSDHVAIMAELELVPPSPY